VGEGHSYAQQKMKIIHLKETKKEEEAEGSVQKKGNRRILFSGRLNAGHNSGCEWGGQLFRLNLADGNT